MNTDQYYAALDIGAGRGAKIAFFNSKGKIASESLFGVEDYCLEFSEFADTLARKIKDALPPHGKMLSMGISSAGILSSDGGFQLFANCARYNGHNIRKAMEEAFDIPVAIDNDANTGALAEWSVLKMELLYWVFGGGWGGAWVSEDGQVLHPAHDWDGRDSSLHYTNEPGYAIPLSKHRLRLLFLEVGASYELFEQHLIEDPDLPESVLLGPGGCPDSLRAEVILSGPGRCRLFRALVGDDTFYERFLDIHELNQINDPSIAGKHISKLSNMRVESAVNTDRLYGKILAEAARIMFKAGAADGLRGDLPIFLGGKPSYALPYFGPSCQRVLGKMGIMSYLRPSVLDEKNLNANLVGASVLARRAYETR
ncbi:ROK family protein [Oceanispirochaeta crateris]|uniref:ROK family protein n=1 Tax=Oceanispirochaeta crateris TaxID=2518645 RepID=A0A5C1QI44_9SPIO|nr:ROK family protein [Oceanispirochaeta crateris]QEN06958.1 ROK family protein [Oceanispirochaeta crateris]